LPACVLGLPAIISTNAPPNPRHPRRLLPPLRLLESFPTRHAARWLDFKSHQIFDEAITYTALQFFRGSPNETLTCVFAPDGNAAAVQWETADQVPYDELPEEDAWTLAPKAEMELVSRLVSGFGSMEKSCAGIFVGIQTSMNDLFHLEEVAPGKFRNLIMPESEVVELESDLIHPIPNFRPTRPKSPTFHLQISTRLSHS
jgi:hypothetical protein